MGDQGSEFSSGAPNDFDNFSPTDGWARVNRSLASEHIETWRVNAANMAKMFSLIYGPEWLGERAQSVQLLRGFHLDLVGLGHQLLLI